MDKYPKRIFVRVSEEEHAQAMQLASSLGITCSDLVRVFIKLPAGYFTEGGEKVVVLVDNKSVCRLARETRHWGYQYNQVVKALNTIALCMRRDKYDSQEVAIELRKVVDRLDDMDDEIDGLTKQVERITSFWLAAI